MLSHAPKQKDYPSYKSGVEKQLTQMEKLIGALSKRVKCFRYKKLIWANI
jgi:hypothetical protein